MKKRMISLLLMLLLFGSLSLFAYAETYTVGSDWNVDFTSSAKMENRFKNADLTQALSRLEPGDTMVLQIPLNNLYSRSADFYMWNKVVESLETHSSATNGAYSYLLTYTDPAGVSREIFNSATVGGEAGIDGREGMKEATSGLENYFLLGAIGSNQSGRVDLTVTLDGETQSNVYQNTQGELNMRFAVEVPQENSRRTTIVKTGDEYRLVPLYIAMIISGLVFLYLALDAITDRKYGKRG